MSCRACETVVQAPMPTLPIEKGRPGPALLAHVLVSKYCDHLPLYRQAHIYARSGVEIDRSVMAAWVGHMAVLLEAPGRRIARHVRAGGRASCRRYAGSRARSRPRPDKDRPTVDGGERREPLRIDGTAGGLLSLLA